MTTRDNLSWLPRVSASSRSFAGHRAQVRWISEDFPQAGSLEAKAVTRPPRPGGAPYKEPVAAPPPEGAAFVPRPCKGRIPVASRRSCVPQVRLMRPFQGRGSWGARIPGALPPATLSIPFGDCQDIENAVSSQNLGHALQPHSTYKRGTRLPIRHKTS
jgi:hypothetical protein